MAAIRPGSRGEDRIDTTYDYEVCAWARHFNTSQQRIREAVQAVGDRADRVREHLSTTGAVGARRSPGRPSAS